MKRYKISVFGRVQGVGFRPTVYRYAKKGHLSGFVSNTTEGVIIEIEGGEKNIKNFLRELKTAPPVQSRITKINISGIPPKFDGKFIIKKSGLIGRSVLNIAPDISVCGDCLSELFSKTDRRYLYPFINCTNCGPRFSIIADIPYDRKNTTMREFLMCGNCGAEYGEPSDRRFHAQPVACWKCGPEVKLVGSGKWEVGSGSKAIQKTVELLKKGKIIAVKGIGGYHIACDASNDVAVSDLRRRKNRPDKPFAVMMPDIETVKVFCCADNPEEKILTSPERPIVLLKKLPSARRLSENISPNNNSLGVMLPYTPLHYLLFRSLHASRFTFSALVMTSGNRQDEPICKDNKEALNELSHICDYFLTHDRKIFNRCDDSIVRVQNNDIKIIRRSRGYVPNPIPLPARLVPDILAAGAELKNTFCLTRKDDAYPSQYIGDLKDAKTLEFYKDAIEKMKNILKVEPKAVACDIHPDYLSTQYANGCGLPAVPVQHHHAHIASVCAENRLGGNIIGVSFDGTGYGLDGNIWGGEFLVVSGGKFERKYHLKYIKLPGGDAATNEIWRIGFSYLYTVLGASAVKYFRTNVRECRVVKKMIDKNINCPLTSSVGRLFDAVVSIMDLRQETTFEAQAAVELEQMAGCPGASWRITDCYGYDIAADEIDAGKIIIGIVNDLKSKKSEKEISIKFHNTLAKIILDVCRTLRNETKINKVALSGGVFQNAVLSEKSVGLLAAAGFEVFTNKIVPANDGGISLGQVWVARQLLTK